jgi:hypothetical protein
MNSASPARKTISLLGILAVLALAVSPALAQDQGISDSAQQQIANVLSLKAQFTDAEKKMSSDLAFLSMGARGVDISSVSGMLGAQVDANGEVIIEVRGSAAQSIQNTAIALDGDESHVIPVTGGVAALFPVSRLAELAADPNVKTIQYLDQGTTNVGSLTTQGYVTHKANQAGINNGIGVKIGVMSDSASAAKVAQLIASGDLGPDTVLLEASSGTDEGAAMMEIIHDMAPGAQLFFATANGGQPHMAANIAALEAAGCSIIVDDVSYFAEPAFQDGPIARAVNTFTSHGGLYFSAAANSGNVTNGTAGTWEGDFVDGGPVTGAPIGAGAGNFHAFAPGQNYDPATAVQTQNFYTLKWSDPLAGSANDYDFFVLNPAGTAVKRMSVAAQSGTQDPLEQIQMAASGVNAAAVGDRIVVVLFSGATRALRIDANRGRLAIVTPGSTYGHNGGPSTITVAATFWNSAHSSLKPFDGAHNPIETFSSDGPRKMFYNPDGSAITPGNVLFGTNGGATYQKPDMTAADGVSTHTSASFNPFFGTSAAAPHAAAIAALIKSANFTLTNAQIRNIMIGNALNNMAPGGWDRDGGFGVVMAQPAVNNAAAMPH